MACPSFSQDRLLAASNAPNCDSMDFFFSQPPLEIYSHYGYSPYWE